MTDGLNTIGIEVYGYSAGDWMETLVPRMKPGTLGKVYLYSQPRLRIEDFVFTTRGDSARVNGVVDFAVVMANSYRNAEKITLGYDIYSSAGKLLTYNLIEREIPAESTDTIRCREILSQAMKSRWSPATPSLYKLMLYTRRDGRITEYIPLRFGLQRDRIARRRVVDQRQEGPARSRRLRRGVRPGHDQASAQSTQGSKDQHDLRELSPARVVPDLRTDRLAVVDQANINAGFRKDDRNVGGSVANDPAFLPHFIDRVAVMQGRSKNHTCVVALSLAADAATATTSIRPTGGSRGRFAPCSDLPRRTGRMEQRFRISPDPRCPAAAERRSGQNVGRAESQNRRPPMNIDLIVIGKTDSSEVQALVAGYLKRLNFYTKVTLVTLPDLKNTRHISAESQKRQEGEMFVRSPTAIMSFCSTRRGTKCVRSISRCGSRSG